MSNKYELQGQIKLINDTQTFDSGFQKREFVVTSEDDKYPQDVKFEVVKDGCEKLDDYNVGDNVNVSFNIRGNEFKDKFYVNLQCWRMEAQAGTQTVAQAKVEAGQDEPSEVVDDDSQLPF